MNELNEGRKEGRKKGRKRGRKAIYLLSTYWEIPWFFNPNKQKKKKKKNSRDIFLVSI